MNDDRDVRELFARLKEEDRAHTPSFRMPTRKQRSWSPRLVAAAVIALIAFVLARPDPPPQNVSRGVVRLDRSTWRSPTDFLLNTPGSELMRTVPTVGSPDSWGPINLPRRSPVPESTRSQRISS
jgi:hypothetical protein